MRAKETKGRREGGEGFELNIKTLNIKLNYDKEHKKIKIKNSYIYVYRNKTHIKIVSSFSSSSQFSFFKL